MNNKNKGGNGILLFVMIAGMSINLINVSIINVILPKIMEQFQISAVAAQWLSTGFMLLSGIVIALVPFLSKRFSYKALFISAMTFLVAGSLLCALSPVYMVMLIGRLVQSIGYGMLLPLSMILVLAVTPPEKRSVNMGILGIGMMLAPAIGPTVAGIAITYFSWKIMFLIMAVVGAIIIIISMFTFHYKNEKQATQLDVIGVLLSAAGLSSLLYGISSAGKNGWNQFDVIAFIAAGMILLAAFVFYQTKRKNPLLDLRVFKDFNFTSNIVVTVALQMAFYGGLILMPIYFENVMGFSGLKTGLLLLPGSLLIGVMGIFSGKLYDKIGIKPLAITGTLIMAVASFFLSKLTPDTSTIQSAIIYTVFALGVSIVTTPITTAAMQKISKEQTSDAAALQNTIRQIAGSVGTAVLITTMSNAAKNYFTDFSGTVNEQAKLLAANHGINVAFVLTIALCLVAVILSFFLTSKKKLEKAKA